MIAIVPVRFVTNTDVNSVWSEDVFRKWMQPLLPFSLGDFWWSCSQALFSVDCTIYPPIVITDPRIGAAPGNGPQRSALVNGSIAAATSQVSPDWDHTDIVMFWYAQPTDMFGGGSYAVPLRRGGTKNIPATVVDIASPFDSACQELGHSFGLNHEVDDAGRDYASPYSVMSARHVTEFVRAADARLPDGIKILDPNDPMFNNPAQRIIGPALPAAQLYKYTNFRHTPKAIQLSDGYKHTPAVVVLYALNYMVRHPEGPLPILAWFWSNAGEARVFTVEFRRGGHGYDTAIGTSGRPAGLVVHSINPDDRVRYEGVVPVSSVAPRTDWHSAAGNFSLRLLDVDSATEFVKFVVFGGDGWHELDHNTASVDIAADDERLYQLHKDGRIWIYTGVPQTGWQEVDANPATMKIVASGGQLYQLHNSGNIFRYTGTPHTGWQLLDRNSATADIVADGNNLYQLHKDGRIWVYTGTPVTGWLELDANPATKKICAGGGHLYQIHKSGVIWVYTGTPHTGWLRLDINAASDDIVASGSSLYQMHKDKRIWVYTGTPITGWIELDANPQTRYIAASHGNLFQLHQSGQIWRYTGVPHTGWFEMDNNSQTKKIVATQTKLHQIFQSGRILSHFV